MIKVKICGVMEPEHALAAARAGADFVGVVLAPSRRRVTPGKARQLVEAVRGEFPAAPALVGVYADAPPKFVNESSAFCGFDYVQLSGSEPWEYVRHIQRPVIKALKVPTGLPREQVLALLEAELKQASLYQCRIPLVEAQAEGVYGGSGKAFDWEVARQLAQGYQFMLAGGLTPENVAGAIQLVRPWGVDVSSGVESQGVKDVSKIAAFVRAGRGALGTTQ